MKRNLLIVALMLCCSAAFAQDLDDIWNYPKLLDKGEAPNSLLILPPAPTPADAQFAYDMSQYYWGKIQRNTPRGKQAFEDAILDIDHVLANFSPCMGIVMTRTTTPVLTDLLAGILVTDSMATGQAKEYYNRTRPFVLFEEQSLTPDDEHYLKDNGSYPSGHTCFGWAAALVLAEINPARQNEILKYGYEFGQSRVICGVHFQSDVDAGRVMGAALVARLHADKDFMKKLEKAKKEFAKVSKKYPVAVAAE